MFYYSLRKSRVSDEWPRTRATSTSSKNDIDPLDSQTPTRCDQEVTRKNERHQRAFVAAHRGTFARRQALRCSECDQDLGWRQDEGGRDHEGGEVLVAMVTHEGPERCVTKALELLEGSPSLTAPPLVMPILKD